MAPLTKTSRFHRDFGLAIRRFPFAILAAGLATAGILVGDFDRSLMKSLFNDPDDAILALVLSFFTATIMVFASSGQRLWVRVLAEGTGFLIGFSLLFWVKFGDYTVPPLFFAFVCFMSVTAGIAARQGMSGFWLANTHLILSLAACLLALGVVLAGGAIVFSVIYTLLGWHSDKLVMILGILVTFFAFPLLWLTLVASVTVKPIDVTQDDILLRAVAVLTDALLIPLMLTFGAIIHLYAIRIVFLGELPKGQIGMIVPLFLALGYGTYLLASGPHAQFVRFRRLFQRAWLASTLIPLALLTLATAIRVVTYGVTEERYWLILVIVGAVFLVMSALVRRPFDIRLVPLTGGVLALVAAIGPLSAENVTIYSQSAQAGASISSAGSNLNGTKTFKPSNSFINFSERKVIRFGPATFIDDVYLDHNSDAQNRYLDSIVYTVMFKNNVVEVVGENSTSRFDLSPLLTKYLSDTEHRPPQDDPYPAIESSDGRRGAFIVRNFSGETGPAGLSFKHVIGKIILY
ncbi:DUF4153 domain-containing protein [Microvirga calopogonii]|uniref:DUF4153 domain-containing protein n=1 Tax=Microvirga calopogonii TaxID=2078013 RepID=UPI000E0D9BC5|nr:DUF4153 domain-containing protein [Microvirga calopogonii]